MSIISFSVFFFFLSLCHELAKGKVIWGNSLNLQLVSEVIVALVTVTLNFAI